MKSLPAITAIGLCLVFQACSFQTETPAADLYSAPSAAIMKLDAVRTDTVVPLTRQRFQHKAPRRTGPAELFSAADLPLQTFLLDATQGGLISGAKGTVLSVAPGSFVTKNGKPVTGEIQITLREALSTEDLVLAGLSTMADGHLLESGGTIYVNAKSGDEELQLKQGKSVLATVPQNRSWERMKIWKGQETKSGVNWIDPQNIVAGSESISDSAPNNIVSEEGFLQGARPYLTQSARDDNQVFFFGDSLHREEIILQIKNGDTVFFNRRKYAGFWKGEDRRSARWETGNNKESYWQWDFVNGNWASYGHDVFDNARNQWNWKNLSGDNNMDWPAANTPAQTAGGNVNTFQADANATGVFQLKHLGWANIDRFFADSRTKDVVMKTCVDNADEFSNVNIALAFVKEQMYLPGYMKKDKTYSFTHGDYEKPRLPVGAEAWIIVSAYQNEKAFFVMKKIIISADQEIHLSLAETTKEKMQEELKTNL